MSPIDEAEALPQLEYLAYEMCKLGVQRLTEDEILDLLERFRRDYPSIRAVKKRSEVDFLKILEARSSILIKSGNIWRTGSFNEHPAWEFRHLTFQEYLAAQAILDGRYPERDKSLSLAEQVAPLAGILHEDGEGLLDQSLHQASEAWRETIRLLIADCKDDDVDDVLQAVLNCSVNENKDVTSRTRAVLAALCLADEPNVSEELGVQIIRKFVGAVNEMDGDSFGVSPLTDAALELSRSEWYDQFRNILLQSYFDAVPEARANFGSLWGLISAQRQQTLDSGYMLNQLKSSEPISVVDAALSIMEAAFSRTLTMSEDLPIALLETLERGSPCTFASIWALGWLTHDPRDVKSKPFWIPDDEALQKVSRVLFEAGDDEVDIKFWALRVLSSGGTRVPSEWIAPYLGTSNTRIREAALMASAKCGDDTLSESLFEMIQEKESIDRYKFAIALGRRGDLRSRPYLIEAMKTVVAKSEFNFELIELGSALIATETDPIRKILLSTNHDGKSPTLWNSSIDDDRILQSAKVVQMSECDVRALYESMAADYNLTIASSKGTSQA